MPQPLFPGKDPVPFAQEAGWAPGLVWTCAKNLALTGIRSPDLPARSQSLYRLSYPTHVMPVKYISWKCVSLSQVGVIAPRIQTEWSGVRISLGALREDRLWGQTIALFMCRDLYPGGKAVRE
jgi:hypothetical protein